MNWLEISLTVNGELAEAVAEVLARYAPNGVMTEQGVPALNDEDMGTADGPITVRGYLPADDHLEERRQQVEEGLHYLGMIQTLPSPVYRDVADRNWMEAWRDRYQPIPIGRRLMVLPAWLKPAGLKRIPIKIEPGMAFGTGTHPSTQLCLEFLDDYLDPAHAGAHKAQSRAARTMIDVGCGSGILSIAAMKLGVKTALAVDIDPVSIENARENARRNGIGSRLVLGIGSLAEILEGRFGVRSASLVVANILAPIIIQLLEAGLARLLEPNGSLIVAGILETQATEVLRSARQAGLVLRARRQSGEWVAFSLSHPRRSMHT